MTDELWLHIDALDIDAADAHDAVEVLCFDGCDHLRPRRGARTGACELTKQTASRPAVVWPAAFQLR